MVQDPTIIIFYFVLTSPIDPSKQSLEETLGINNAMEFRQKNSQSETIEARYQCSSREEAKECINYAKMTYMNLKNSFSS